MALPLDNRQVNNIVSTTLDERRPELIDNFFTGNALLLKLYKDNRVVVKGGDQIQTSFIYGQVDGGAYQRGDPFSSSITEFMTQLRQDWKMYYGAMNWHGLDVAKNQGAAAVIDYTDAVMTNARMTLENKFGNDLYGSGGAGKVDGLDLAISDSGTYGGITRDTSAQGTAIKSIINTTGGPFSLPMVNTSYGDATLGNEAPDLIVSGQVIFNKVWERSQPSERNTPGGVRSIGWKGNTVTFNAAEWVVDNHCPAGEIWILNTRYLELVILSGRDFKVRGPFDLHLEDASVGQLILTCNLVVKAPRLQSKIKSVT